MGTIRMVMLDGLTVADLLALRQGGFFEGVEVRVAQPSAAPITLPVQEVVQPVAEPVEAAPVLTPEQVELLAVARQELADYRAESRARVAVEAPTEAPAGIDSSPAAVAHLEPPAAVGGGLPSVGRLAACTKLRDVLQLLIEGGMPSTELAAYLESVKAEVPLLQRISNIGDRVSRTLEVMGSGA